MKSSITTVKVIRELKKLDAPAWERVVDELTSATRRGSGVNLSSIERYSAATILVPGTVLGTGELSKAVTVAALRFSKSAREKITKAGGKTMTIAELAKENPKCSNVKIMV
ncbi:MAG: 50S ribosomal protein L18e [Candidatus Aenigmarchaeota archaeon]|nr:50S ribosomal protein L18e [Candidatus Aenigmarchaeota archaeon]